MFIVDCLVPDEAHPIYGPFVTEDEAVEWDNNHNCPNSHVIRKLESPVETWEGIFEDWYDQDGFENLGNHQIMVSVSVTNRKLIARFSFEAGFRNGQEVDTVGLDLTSEVAPEQAMSCAPWPKDKAGIHKAIPISQQGQH